MINTKQPKKPTTRIETAEVLGSQLVKLVKQVIKTGHALRIIVRAPDDTVLIDIPISHSLLFASALQIFWPFMAPLAAIAVAFRKVKVEIVRPNEEVE